MMTIVMLYLQDVFRRIAMYGAVGVGGMVLLFALYGSLNLAHHLFAGHQTPTTLPAPIAPPPSAPAAASKDLLISKEDALQRAKQADAQKDYSAAVYWLKIAAEKNDAFAQVVLGNLYTRGYHTPQDYAEALRWYRRAAEQNQTDAEYSMGVAYLTGQGVVANCIEAVRWFEMAAKKDDWSSQLRLTTIYAVGCPGIAVDMGTANYWYEKFTAQSKKLQQFTKEDNASHSTDSALTQLASARGALLAEVTANSLMGILMILGFNTIPLDLAQKDPSILDSKAIK
jgi:hypothetical protein